MDNHQDSKHSSTNNQDAKQTPTRVPFTRLNQAESDLAIAMTLQEQERASRMLETIDSDSEEEDDDYESEDYPSNNNDPDYYEMYLNSQDFEGDMYFLEGEDSNDGMDMEEDEVDPDELSYEELIALGEFIGEEKRGLSVNEIPGCLSPCRTRPMDKKVAIDKCVICQVEYEENEALVALHPCEHPYHSDCISKWLQVRKTCPICSSEASSPKNVVKQL